MVRQEHASDDRFILGIGRIAAKLKALTKMLVELLLLIAIVVDGVWLLTHKLLAPISMR
jgi:hypothetical protein